MASETPPPGLVEQGNYEPTPKGQIIRLSHQLVESLYIPHYTGSEQQEKSRSRQELTRLIDIYSQSQTRSIPEDLKKTVSKDALNIFGIIKVYLDDEAGLLQIPTEVVTLFEDDQGKEIGSGVTSRILLKRKLADIKDRSKKSFENANYRPLVVIGYRRRGHSTGHWDLGDKKFGDDVLDGGNATLLLYNMWASNVLHPFGTLKSQTILIDTDTCDTAALDEKYNLDLECQNLGITEHGRIESQNVKVAHGIIQSGGDILSSVQTVNVATFIQTGGSNKIPRIRAATYIHRGGKNISGDTVITQQYILGKGAELNANKLILVGDSNLINEGGTNNSELKTVPPDYKEASPDDMYEHFGRELVKYFFPSDNEYWTEMQQLFTLWYKDFQQNHEIPSNFLEKYQDHLSGQHTRNWYNYEYTAGFGHIASMVAFFYLNRLAPLPNFNRDTIINTPDIHEFRKQVNQAYPDNVLIILNSFPSGIAKRFLRQANGDFGDATIYKGGMDVTGNFMRRFPVITAQTIIINSHPDIKTTVGDSSMEHDEFYYDIFCDNLGIMPFGKINGKVNLICYESVLQYGTIGKVYSIKGEGDESIKQHMQIAGTNEALYEECLLYEQQGGWMKVGKLVADRYHLTHNGVASDSQIYSNLVRISGGHLENVTIQCDHVELDHVTIKNGTTLTIKHHKGFPPIIGDHVDRSRIVIQELS